mmetsp:Transcript_6558/g.14517  ORF Transcript_6558/g.14517 Transcript_6558/m.14517 type:complete len:239 (+) Transcript_6558:606-1322(+)
MLRIQPQRGCRHTQITTPFQTHPLPHIHDLPPATQAMLVVHHAVCSTQRALLRTLTADQSQAPPGRMLGLLPARTCRKGMSLAGFLPLRTLEPSVSMTSLKLSDTLRGCGVMVRTTCGGSEGETDDREVRGKPIGAQRCWNSRMEAMASRAAELRWPCTRALSGDIMAASFSSGISGIMLFSASCAPPSASAHTLSNMQRMSSSTADCVRCTAEVLPAEAAAPTGPSRSRQWCRNRVV